jgi:hypothetical protein
MRTEIFIFLEPWFKNKESLEIDSPVSALLVSLASTTSSPQQATKWNADDILDFVGYPRSRSLQARISYFYPATVSRQNFYTAAHAEGHFWVRFYASLAMTDVAGQTITRIKVSSFGSGLIEEVYQSTGDRPNEVEATVAVVYHKPRASFESKRLRLLY